jgi:hypothetical protein
MTTIDNETLVKTSEYFYCDCCNYKTSRKYNFNLHIESNKHNNNVNNLKNNGSLVKTSKTYKCDTCSKIFNDRAGLWRHNKKCTYTSEQQEEPIRTKQKINSIDKDELIIMLLKQNSEIIKEQADIKELILKIVNLP